MENDKSVNTKPVVSQLSGKGKGAVEVIWVTNDSSYSQTLVSNSFCHCSLYLQA